MFGWEKETQHEKIMKELNKLEKGDYDQAYKESEAIYESVKKHYLRKIKSPGFDIKIEKIRLEQNLGMHNSVATTSSINYYGAILCALLPMFFETTGILNNKLNGGITSLSLISSRFYCKNNEKGS
jgi:hypothetical protein